MKVFYLNDAGQPEIWEANTSEIRFDRLLKRGGGLVEIRRDGQVLLVHTDTIWSAESQNKPKEQTN